ncbi:DISARM system helicase DrmA [Rariglobus hedericola]|uniref:Helicase n=1 Tax=Rariglobus hedericola TaxID=2597822 RepID=A0A556QJE5_9BACT|nr:DISARM system helicase DrmA [Rariglobus hedericola]TSJ76758.1 helicase [Rariglobus hedericola]
MSDIIEQNAWLITADPDLSTTIEHHRSRLVPGIKVGDGVAIINQSSAEVMAFARIYRVRSSVDATTLYYDCFVRHSASASLTSLGLPTPTSMIQRIDWPTYEAAFAKSTGSSVTDIKPISGESLAEQAHLRRLLQFSVMDDLLGPANGPDEEVIGMSVRDRYLVGKLAPKEYVQEEGKPSLESEEADAVKDLTPKANDDHISNEKKSTSRLSAKGEDEDNETDRLENQSLVPSSIGFTFCLDGDATEIELEARWGRYHRGESAKETSPDTGKPLRAWKRTPSGNTIPFPLVEGPIKPFAIDPACPEVIIKGIVRPVSAKGDRLITLFLINNQEKPEEAQDSAWLFQPEVIVRGIKGATVFRRRPVLEAQDTDDLETRERIALEMVYRKRVEFAVGHGIAVHATTAADSEKAREIRTVVMPTHELPVTETPGTDPHDRPAMRKLVEEGTFDMEQLAALDRPALVAALKILTEDYAAWIGEQTSRIPGEFSAYMNAAEEAMGRCDKVLARLREGITAIETNDHALAAFRFANLAMARQRVRSIYSLKRRRKETTTVAEENIPKNRSWRPFQLAFVLLSIPALSDPKHHDRTEPLMAAADLLWFPTGGGKTEAYLGVAAFTMAIRRLQTGLGGYDSSRGLSVIMRYTLRLLTIQQFQRATTLLCAMETLRKADVGKWGATPFTLGLWVGNKVSPGTTERAHAVIESERDGTRGGSDTPAQLTFCPWCGSDIVPGRDISVDRDCLRTTLYCGDKTADCDFAKKDGSDGLPVVVVDEEIYRRPPSMLIGTVDKFAMMAWRGETRTLFGRAEHECERHGLLWPGCDCNQGHKKKGALKAVKVQPVSPIRPPDLIIQDEFHLISGPLGTMVGLYETTVDEMSAWPLDGKTIRPKIIASTATVRKAQEQVHHVFMRNVSVFPPHGLDIEDNFFSVQRPVTEKPGRLYLGICSPGSSRPAVLIRLYVALLTGAQKLYNDFGKAADPYMTLVGYFNSLRELGGMRRLAEDDVQTRAFRVLMGRVNRPGLAQRSVKVVEELTSRVSSKEIPKKLDQLETKFKPTWAKGEARAIDIVLATNMLSVGVDVNRLGLMAVNGQPKSTAEYIQATSRVGRSYLGLVCSVLTWSRPRDLSHYETFEHYHATFYKHVEAQSVTPFAARALDRGLTGAYVSLLRLTNTALNPNLGAMALTATAHPDAQRMKDAFANRAWKVRDEASAKTTTSSMVAQRLDHWVKEANKPGRRLGYETENGQGDIVALMKKPGLHRWDIVTAPMSLREVEPGVRLIMDTATLEDGPAWQIPVKDKPEDNDNE